MTQHVKNTTALNSLVRFYRSLTLIWKQQSLTQSRQISYVSSAVTTPANTVNTRSNYVTKDAFFGRHLSTSATHTNTNDNSAKGSVTMAVQQLSVKLQHARSLKRPLSRIQATIFDLSYQICRDYPQLPALRPQSASATEAIKTTERQQILHLLTTTLASPLSENLSTILSHHNKTSSYNEDRQELTIENINDSQYSLDFAEKVRRATTPAYEDICECLLQQNIPQAILLLVQWREDSQQWKILSSHEQNKDHNEHLLRKRFDTYLGKLLSMWFAPGLLQVEKLTYENSPAALIERVAKYEAVHPVQSLQDLKVRLGPDRRVYCLMAPALMSSGQPLVVLHVALLTGIPNSMHQVHNDSSAETASVACFYSITNFRPGLAGLGLGEYLLKRAVSKLQNDEKHLSISEFVTLSPIPRFRAWLEERISYQDGKFASTILSHIQRQTLADALHCSENDALSTMLHVLKHDGISSLEQGNTRGECLKSSLQSLAAHYLVQEKHRRKPLCNVARFHLGNGARLYRINVNADTSRKGWQNSFGVMVNYQYELEHLSRRQVEYEEGYTVCVSHNVKDILDLTT